MSESNLIRKGPCDQEACGSSDGMATYDDGHTYCFVCGHLEKGNRGAEAPARPKRVSGLLTGEIRGLRARKLTDETCRHYGYAIGTYRGEDCHIAPYHDREGNLVAQHLRTPDKNFPWLGTPKDAVPFGFHASAKAGKMVTICEGEIDAMSLSQAQNNKWPVWSIGSGAGPQIRKYIAERRELFLQFEKVVIMFDNDAPGREAAKVAASIIGPKARIAELPLKDASDMLVAGRVQELIDAMWKAQVHKMDGLVELSTLEAEVFESVKRGIPWCLEKLNEWTYGRRTGEVYAIGAGTGTGKSDFLAQQVKFDITELGINVGVFFFEQNPAETALRITGKIGQRAFHVPNPEGGWTTSELEAAWEQYTEAPGKVYAYDSFGVNDWDVVEERIRYLYHAVGVRHFYIDHLTALAAWQDDERKALEVIMSDIGGLVKELDIAVYLISHLATPEGKPHEEGGRVMIRHFKGSRAIGFWCHYMFGMERNQQDDDPITRVTTTFRCLKDRYTGRSTGSVFYLRYNPETSLLYEVDTQSAPEKHGFKAEGDAQKQATQKEDF